MEISDIKCYSTPVLVQVEIWNNLYTMTVSSSFWAKFSELSKAIVIFVLTIENLRNMRKVHRKQGQNVVIKEWLRIKVINIIQRNNE